MNGLQGLRPIGILVWLHTLVIIVLADRLFLAGCRLSTDSAGAFIQLQTLDAHVDHFTQTLPRLDGVGNAHPTHLRGILVVYTLCYCATLQLHASRDQPLDVNTSKTVMAANAVADLLRLIDVSRLRFIDPIMGVSQSRFRRACSP